jgi:hypothetical protein
MSDDLVRRDEPYRLSNEYLDEQFTTRVAYDPVAKIRAAELIKRYNRKNKNLNLE